MCAGFQDQHKFAILSDRICNTCPGNPPGPMCLQTLSLCQLLYGIRKTHQYQCFSNTRMHTQIMIFSGHAIKRRLAILHRQALHECGHRVTDLIPTRPPERSIRQ